MSDKILSLDIPITGLTDIYARVKHPTDATYLSDATTGAFSARPLTFPAVTEDVSDKKTYQLIISGTIADGSYKWIFFLMVGATQDETNDTLLGGGVLQVKSGSEVVMTDPPAKESTLLALGVSVAALPTVVQISAAVTALGGIGGIITGVVDAGVTVSSSFNPITMEKGEKKVIVYQIKENDVAIDVSAYTFTFGVKRDLYDTVYAFAAVAGVISADDDGVLSIVTFIIPAASTKALAVIESGRYSVGIFDGSGNKVALTPPGGVSFRLTEDILDVA